MAPKKCVQYVETTDYTTKLLSFQGSIRMAPDNRAGLVQEMNDALCNQICKGDLARRMHTDK